MKIDPADLSPGAIAALRGKYVLRYTKQGPVVQSWPRKRGPAKTPAQNYQETEFALAAIAASNPHPLDLKTAIEVVKGTSYVPRDFLFKCAIGTAYELMMPDGTVLQPARYMSTNPQYILDKVTSTENSILVRNPAGWEGITPSAAGQIPIYTENGVEWASVPGTSGVISAGTRWPYRQAWSTGAYACQGGAFNTPAPLSISRVSVLVNATAGWSYIFQVFTYSGSTVSTILGTSGTITIATTAAQVISWTPASPILVPSGTFCVAFLRNDGTGTSPCTPGYGIMPTDWPFPTMQIPNAMRASSTLLSAGSSITIAGTSNLSTMGFDANF